jgi:hypothetical protein
VQSGRRTASPFSFSMRKALPRTVVDEVAIDMQQRGTVRAHQDRMRRPNLVEKRRRPGHRLLRGRGRRRLADAEAIADFRREPSTKVSRLLTCQRGAETVRVRAAAFEFTRDRPRRQFRSSVLKPPKAAFVNSRSEIVNDACGRASMSDCCCRVRACDALRDVWRRDDVDEC